jgi:fructose-1,6-bisphosphatase II
MSMATAEEPDRNLALELMRATEAASLAAGRWMGRADKESGDASAVDAMRLMLASVEMDGTVVIGEGEKDEAPMLFNGERIGTGRAPAVDIAVDPIDGTRLLSEGRQGALAVIAAAPRGAMLDPGPMVYMDKWVVGPDAVGVVDIDAPIGDNLAKIAKAKGKDVNDLTVIMLERDRHQEMFRDVREAGARLRLITDGDVAASMLAATPEQPVDALLGIGGTPEGVVSACAVRAIGGEMLGRLWPRNDDEAAKATEAGYDVEAALGSDDLVGSDDTFFVCTGITSGELVEGVVYGAHGVTTDSFVARGKSGTIRWIRGRHTLNKLMEYSAIDFG